MSIRFATGAFAMLVILALVAGLTWIAHRSTSGDDPSAHAVRIEPAEQGARIPRKDSVAPLSTLAGNPEMDQPKDSAERMDRPFLAIWNKSRGHDSRSPYLRIAIWDDGRIWFAMDPNKWSHSIRQGQIPADLIARLKEDILKTGVFDLKGYCYLVPDAPVDCLMLGFSGRSQMLYWDEREMPNYGINIDPKPHHLKFKECWKMVNKLALNVVPARSEPVSEGFRKAPRSWYLKEPIQSE